MHQLKEYMKKNIFLRSKETILCCSIACMITAVFSSCGSKKYTITSIGENLSALTKVTETEDDCFSPFGGDNGKNLYFASGGFYSNIFKKDNAFSSSMNERTSGNNRNFAPTYCELIDKVAFSGKLEGSTLADIYMMNNSQGKALTQITNTPDAEECYPCFSPDGKFIVYDKRPANLGNLACEIWLKNISTGENILLGKGRMPSFSPDGKNIVYVKYSADAEYTSLWTMNIEGDNQVQITDSKLGAVWHPRFSPDGEMIVFDCFKKQKKDVDLYIINKDGNNLTQLTINKSYDGQPYWSSDGYIYFASDRGGKDGHYQIWRFKW